MAASDRKSSPSRLAVTSTEVWEASDADFFTTKDTKGTKKRGLASTRKGRKYRIKFEARNPKFETNSNGLREGKFKTSCFRRFVHRFEFEIFLPQPFVSDFDIRISKF